MAELLIPTPNPLPIGNGGTGQTTATAGFDALSPLTTQGDVLYYNGTHNVRLGNGTSGQVLKTLGAAANPAWTSPPFLMKIPGTASAGNNPANGATYFFIEGLGLSTGEIFSRVYIGRACTISRADLYIAVSGTLATTESSTVSIRVNNTTDTAISAAVKANASTQLFTNSGLSISLNAGDFIAIKWVTPTWVTPPTTILNTVFLVLDF